MPIKFRCPHCEQFLGISRGKAGSVTDCPMCGRTIRVPDLDGKVAPLPKPRLDHADSGLANALDALAALENSAEFDAPIPIPQKAIAVSVAAGPVVEAVPIPEALPAPPVTPPGGADSGPLREREALAELAAITPPDAARPRAARANGSRVPMVGGAALLLGLLLGFGLGRATAPTSSQPAPVVAVNDIANGGAAPAANDPATLPSVVPSPSGEPPAPPAIVPGIPQRALEGRITYISATGESKPDTGARILVIPAKHPNAVKLGVLSFRSGASAIDLQIGQASIRALGGDFALTDADGRYSINLPAAGQYRVFIGSRYQARPSETSPDAAQVKALETWVDQPRAFFGSTQTTMADLTFDGGRVSVRDHVFTRVE